MNVVHVFPYHPWQSGGHSNAIRSFIDCQRAGGLTAVGVAPPVEQKTSKEEWDFPLYEVGTLWGLRWEAVAKHFGFKAEETVLHFHSINRRFAPVLQDMRRCGIPWALTSHGQLNFQGALHWFKKLVYLQVVNRGPCRASGLHLLTKFAERRMRFLLPGFTGPTLVQGNILKLPDLERIPAAPRSDYGIPADAFLLLFLGRLDVYVKGLDVLVEAFSCLPPKRFHLGLVGPDVEGGKARLEQFAQQLGCQERLHFLGPAYGDKKWAVLKMADLFVSPSRREAFSIAQAEAMSCGLPVLTSNAISLAQELREADAALLAPLVPEPIANAMATLEADPELLAALGRRGKAWAENNCNAQRAGARFRQFYQALLERRPR